MAGCIFLPANGARRNANGALTYTGVSAFYWSSEQANAINGRGFRADEMGSGAASPHKAFGYNIRCVHDVSTAGGDESSSSSASILNITQASYSRALTNYNRVAVDTMYEGMPKAPAETTDEAPNTKLYPNPVINGQLTIDNGQQEIGKVEVLNSNGKVVRTQDFGSQTTGTLLLQGLQGTYFVKVGNNMQSIVVAN
jgi:hypothetical protein